MRNYLFLAGLAAVALTTSCSEDFDLLGNKHEVTLGASVTAESTRAAFSYDETSKKASFFWNTGDEIGVNSTGNATQFSSFTLKTGAGEATATFKGNVYGEVDNTCYAVYPYNDDHAMDGSKLTYVFPDSYTYTKVGQTYFPGGADSNSFNPALWAKVTDSGLAFKHLGGVFLVMVGKMPCAAGKLEFSAQENMAGKSVVDLSSTTPESKNGDNLTDGTTKVTINFSNATVDQDGVFYIPVPTGTYTNLRVKIFENGNEKAVSNIAAGTFTIARRNLYRLTLNGAELSAQETTTVSTASEAQNALEKNNNVAVAAITAADGASAGSPTTATITIPEVAKTSTSEGEDESAETATVTKTVAVEEITENVKITLKDAAESSSSGTEETTKKSVDAVTLSIPNIPVTDDNKEKLPAVEVTMPSSTVTLAGNAGVANFGTVTAETAENTLVVSSGVTIQKLIVKKGNVRIESGAKVVAIEKDASYTGTPIIYVEEGASYPSSLTGFTVTEASFIDTESDFESAMSKGGESFMLTKNLTLSRGYTTGQTVIIDLNGKTLTAPNIIVASGSLTLKNGKIIQTGGNKLIADTGGSLSVDNITYNGEDNTECCIFIKQNAQNASLYVSNSTINGGYYAVTTNATTNPIADECTITLEGSKFYANETGALLNIPASVKMYNCEFSGNHQGAFLRGGEYYISGCTFTLNAELEATHSENNWMKIWQSGNRGAFAALTIGNYLNTAYQYPTNITFGTGNSAVVSGDNASSFPAIHVCANAADDKGVTITGMSSNITKSGGKAEVEYGTSNITVDDTAVTASYISSERDFKAAVADGGTYTMMTNVALSSAYGAEKSTTIDLNGKTLTAQTLGAKTGGTLTLQNGKLVQGKTTVTIASGSPLTKSANKYLVNGHDFVDLGLSVLWAETNIGAASATDYGKYYAWGEVTDKTTYDWTTYKYGTSDYAITKYCTATLPSQVGKDEKYNIDNKSVLENEDDAAYVNWGTSCRIPTEAEIKELANGENCDWTEVKEGVVGFKVTSKKSGYTDNSIFLPASGYKGNSGLKEQGTSGLYWSSLLFPSDTMAGYAKALRCYSTNHHSTGFCRYHGFPIRPVAAK